jgi:hypothetical protein
VLSQLIKPIYRFGVLGGAFGWIIVSLSYYFMAGFEPVLLLSGWLACSGFRYAVSQNAYEVISPPAWAFFVISIALFLLARFSSVYQSIILVSTASLVLVYVLMFAMKIPVNARLSIFSRKVVDDMYIVYVSHMPIIFLVLGLLSSYAFENALVKVLLATSLCVMSILGFTPILRTASRSLENVVGAIIAGKSNG